MEPIKINLTTPVSSQKFLDIESIIERDDELLIKLKDNECYDIYEGQKLTFTRYIYENESTFYTLTENVTVLKETILDEDEKHTHIIHTTLMPNKRITLYNGENSVREYKYKHSGSTGLYHFIKTREDHNIFQQDLDLAAASGSPQEIYIKDYQGNLLDVYSGTSIMVPLKRSDKCVTSGDCITKINTEEVCGKNYEWVETYQYDFLPEKISKDTLIISGFSSDINKMLFLETKYNPFYYYKINANEEKECHLYEDPWWNEYKKLNEDNEGECILKRYVKYGNSRVTLSYNSYYWNVNVGLSSFADESTLGSEDNFNSKFVEDLEQSLIPDIIDMERVKYSPVIKNGNTATIATSITLSFHFRERNKIFVATSDNAEEKEKELKDRQQNTPLTSGNVYTDGWYINPDSGNTIWWNGFASGKTEFDNGEFSPFIEKSGLTSDLIGYLNFTDNDVYYRKKKVTQSFVRLTFYNSTDPIEQKLLYYSTVFLDGNILYGKYIKQMMYMEENDLFNEKKNKGINKNAAVVLCSAITASARVDTQMVITNEYDRTKSSEGFNIYLFAEDVNLNIDENGEKTIYMKVEFNHAGNGKTLPMIIWPKDESGDYVALKVDNFIKSLYIPIKLAYINGKYVYYIPDAYKSDNGNIDLVLFEPKIDYPDEKPKETQE